MRPRRNRRLDAIRLGVGIGQEILRHRQAEDERDPVAFGLALLERARHYEGELPGLLHELLLTERFGDQHEQESALADLHGACAACSELETWADELVRIIPAA